MRSAGAKKVTEKKISKYRDAIFQDSIRVNQIADATRLDVSKSCMAKPNACRNGNAVLRVSEQNQTHETDV